MTKKHLILKLTKSLNGQRRVIVRFFGLGDLSPEREINASLEAMVIFDVDVNHKTGDLILRIEPRDQGQGGEQFVLLTSEGRIFYDGSIASL